MFYVALENKIQRIVKNSKSRKNFISCQLEWVDVNVVEEAVKISISKVAALIECPKSFLFHLNSPLNPKVSTISKYDNN